VGRRIYEAGFDNQSIGSAVQDIFSLLAPATKGIQIHWVHLSAAAVTSPAQIRLRIGRATATVTQGTGGTAPTGFSTDAGDTLASVVTCHCNDTTQATTTGTFFYKYDQWNVLLPYDYQPGPEDEDRDAVLISQLWRLDLPGVVTAVVASGFIKWRELP
jgi:hypothetical protein